MQAVKGRFAPSPTGRMHLGNVFAALLAWLSVRSKGGRILLRIEDLDPQRSKKEYTELLLQDLEWLGLHWDEGYGAGGQNGPYAQSGRSAFYQSMLDKLDAQGLVYPCFCTRAQLHAPSAPHLQDGRRVYNGRCRALPPTQVGRLAQKHQPALRVQVPCKNLAFMDGCQGETQANLATDFGDFVLRRGDGAWAYQLAAPADDGAMGITEVVRGRDLLPSTPTQIWLLHKLGYAPPQYYHTPLLLAPDGRRLSKRDKDLDLGVLRTRLKGPERLLGALAWVCGLLPTSQPATATELVGLFSWEKVPQKDIVAGQKMWAAMQL